MSNFLTVDFQNKVNFACHQNDVAILKRLILTNKTENVFQNIKITMTTSPLFVKQKIWTLDILEPDSIQEFRDRTIELDPDYLLNLKEAMKGSVRFEVEVNGEVIDTYTQSIELLAYNEWGGCEYIPELLSAFVMPNAKGIDFLLGKTANILKENNKDSILNGYASKSSTKVWNMFAALYSTVAKMGINYCLPPQSFEKNGQKIRLPQEILDNKIATCLDISLLFASALEQMQLYPVIILLKGHAFVGVWLKPTSLGSLIIDDAESIRKRIDLKELVVFEAVAVTNPNPPQFNYAISLASDKLAYGQDEDFELMVDIHMARANQLKPLALFSTSNDHEKQADSNNEPVFENNDIDFAPDDLPDYSEESSYDEEYDTSPKNRLNIWQKKLLNLSTINPLLNCRIGKTNLPILCPNPAKLEDYLAGGVSMSIMSAEKVLKTKIDAELRSLRTGEILENKQAQEALENKQLLVNVPESKLPTQLVELYRKTKSLLEEGGSNTLYLAIGFLNWHKDGKKDKTYHAPLILLPVKLERSSVRSGVKLIAHEDESRFNTTLLEMLKQDFDISIPSLEGELPTDDSGLDVPEIWNRVRKAVKETEGFEVVEEVVLGHFSFNKYLMWKDLIDRTDEMMEHPLIASLIDKSIELPKDSSFIDEKILDEQYKPEDFFAPLEMDSSQMAVLAAADKGKSFVIEGPPGTGKSQTIANLISDMIAKGKTVLFVSEKMAALDVVHRRLEQIGLGRFCLQLHSNKANKKDVLNQLKLAWDSSNNTIEKEYKYTADKLFQQRNELNRVVKALHTPGSQGFTPYQAMGACIKYEKLAEIVKFNWASIDIHNNEQYQQMKELVRKLKIQAEQCSLLFKSKAFKLIENEKWEPNWQKTIVASSLNYAQSTIEVVEKCERFLSSISLNLDCKSNLDTLSILNELSSLLINKSLANSSYAFSADGFDKIEALESAIEHLRLYQQSKDSLKCICPSDIWKKVNSNELLEQWQLSKNKWFLAKFFDELKIKQKFKKAGAKGNAILPDDIEILLKLEEYGSKLEDLDVLLKDINVWKKERSNPEELVESQILATKLRQITSQLASSPDNLPQIRKNLNSLLKEGRDLLSPEGCVGQKIIEFNDAFLKYLFAKLEFENLSKNSKETKKISNLDFETIQKVAQELKEQESLLREWCGWQKFKEEAIEIGLKSLIDLTEHSYIEIDQMEQAFISGYCQWWIQKKVTEDNVLREFSSAQHLDKIKQYCQIDSKFQELTKKYICAKLTSQIPSREDSSLQADWKFVQREIQKQRQHKSVRQLLQDGKQVVKTLTPCLMMSPLSVAQYLPVSQETFDVVVFDEASQITVWDAIGALSRGRQVIVAGDPKQMPPSNFFGRNVDYDEEEADLDTDLESILDELIGSSLPVQRLNWHYRSKCESLISFSNYNYYDEALVTFPAAKTDQHSVNFKYIENGVYKKGARINQIEAEVVVAECVKRLTSSDPNIKNKSIGIITFNNTQQKLIQDLLDKERNNNPELEFAFSEENTDSIFVKNLETVQGDERDVILFSITYGKDATGKINMRFGTLNNAGGEKRLNVAVTRARHEMVVFSSILPDQIDLNRTSARGAEDLKNFIAFAQKGKSALGTTPTRSRGGFESLFEQEVANALRQKGWEVHTQIGASSYRIDLSVVNPEMRGGYLAGVECDGATYHSSATARDRDKLRQSVLEGLGWNIIRVWSTDWWTNKHGSIEKLDKQLKELQKTQNSQKIGIK